MVPSIKKPKLSRFTLIPPVCSSLGRPEAISNYAANIMKINGLFRGSHYGVFTGPNGYYCASMASDGVSHYQPQNGGDGWSERARREVNADAESAENEAQAQAEEEICS